MDNLTDKDEVFKIGILVVDGFAMMSYAAVIEPLRAANLLAGRKLYDIRHIPVMGASATSSGGAVIKASAHIGERVDFDFVLVVAGGDPTIFNEVHVLHWLRNLSRRGVLLGGVSGGPVILASAGLMNARRMTVHWEHARALAAIYPDLMIERSLYVMDRDRITCAGGTAPLDMMHALITEHHGADFARRVSDWFMHTEIRPSGSSQRAGIAERYGITNSAVIVAIEAMENHIGDTLSLRQLAEQANVGTRQLNRLFQQKMGQSTMNFYQELRLEKALNLLKQTPIPTTQIALMTGFSSSAHFSHSFRKKYNKTPSCVRSK